MRMDGEAVALCTSVDWGVGLKRPDLVSFCVQNSSVNCEEQHQYHGGIISHLQQAMVPGPEEEDCIRNKEARDNTSREVCSTSQGNLYPVDDRSDVWRDLAVSVAMAKFAVGYNLTAKKMESFLQPTLEMRARIKGITFVRIDPNMPLDGQGPFDVILHKAAGEIWHQQLKVYMQNHPEVVILDPPDAIKKVSNRQSIHQEVSALNFWHPLGKVVVPKQLTIYGDPLSVHERVMKAGLKLPLVAKPLYIDGTAKSHAISLVYSYASLLELHPPMVLQEFVNHGGVLFKVFVVGDIVKVVQRFSLPDIRGGDALENGVVMIPRVSCAAASADGAVTELPPKEMLDTLSRELRHRLGLSLFNLDMIRENGRGNEYYVVDINYFPGYGKMPDYENIFIDYFSSLADKKCQ